MLEAQKAAKAEEKEKAEMAEALEALQGQPIDELLEILNMIKTDIATRGRMNKEASPSMSEHTKGKESLPT